MSDRRARQALIVATAALLLGWAPAQAQGPGSAGAEILQLGAGTRALALGGAYTAAGGDPDALFYNPASIATLRQGAGLGYQAYVQDVTVGSLSGVLRNRGLWVGGGLLFLDAGSIEEVVPDPDYGGERGRPTGERVTATESAARIAAAVSFASGRASAGAAVGLVSSDLAGVGRSGLFIDLGTRARLGRRLAVGATLRNLGPDMGEDRMGDAPLPTLASIGATYRQPIGPLYGAAVFVDGLWGIREQTGGVALGAEAGFLPAGSPVSAVVRGGVRLGEGEGHAGRFRFGGGVSMGELALDYAVQVYEYLGAIHRIGLRWAR